MPQSSPIQIDHFVAGMDRKIISVEWQVELGGKEVSRDWMVPGQIVAVPSDGGIVQHSLFYSSGCSSARQGPRTVMMIIPCRRSALLRKRSRLAVRRFGGVVGLNFCMGGCCADGEMFVMSGVSGARWFAESPSERKRSFRSLRAISLRIRSFSHRMARAINDRKRKMVKDINASKLIITSLF